MSVTAENLIVLAIVAAAALYAGGTLVRWLLPTSGGSCGGCHGCSTKGAPTPIVSLEIKPADDRRNSP